MSVFVVTLICSSGITGEGEVFYLAKWYYCLCIKPSKVLYVSVLKSSKGLSVKVFVCLCVVLTIVWHLQFKVTSS